MSDIMLIDIMLSDIMLSDIMLIDIMLSVMAPFRGHHRKGIAI